MPAQHPPQPWLHVCRKDAGKQEDYNEVSERKFSTVSGVPVSVLDSEYVRLSNELIEEIEAYCTLVSVGCARFCARLRKYRYVAR